MKRHSKGKGKYKNPDSEVPRITKDKQTIKYKTSVQGQKDALNKRGEKGNAQAEENAAAQD